MLQIAPNFNPLFYDNYLYISDISSMPRKTLIPLPDFGLVAHFWDTWKTIRGFTGIAVIFIVVAAFTTIVEWYIARGRERRNAAAHKRQN